MTSRKASPTERRDEPGDRTAAFALEPTHRLAWRTLSVRGLVKRRQPHTSLGPWLTAMHAYHAVPGVGTAFRSSA